MIGCRLPQQKWSSKFGNPCYKVKKRFYFKCSLVIVIHQTKSIKYRIHTYIHDILHQRKNNFYKYAVALLILDFIYLYIILWQIVFKFNISILHQQKGKQKLNWMMGLQSVPTLLNNQQLMNQKNRCIKKVKKAQNGNIKITSNSNSYIFEARRQMHDFCG